MNHTEIEIVDMPTEDYQPLIDFNTWRVAVLKHCENTEPERITAMQRHEETDEVFVLLSGNAILFTAGSGDTPGEIKKTRLTPDRVYNIKKGVWHNHILDAEGAVLIVENQDTTDNNSPVCPLTDAQRAQIGW